LKSDLDYQLASFGALTPLVETADRRISVPDEVAIAAAVVRQSRRDASVSDVILASQFTPSAEFQL